MADFRGVCCQILLTIAVHLLILEYLHTQEIDNSNCNEPMPHWTKHYADKTLTIHWTGKDRNGTVAVYATTHDDYGRTCDNNFSQKADFKEEKISLGNPCSNALYNVTLSLICGGMTYPAVNVFVRTPPDAPTVLSMKPADMSMKVDWSKPTGRIQSYQVTLSGGRKKKNVWQQEVTTKTFWNFTSLEPYTEYEASVKAKNEDHWSVAGPIKSARTLEGVPFEPENLTAVEVSTDKIVLEWDNPEPETGAILWFEVTWTEKGETESTPERTENNSYIIENLFPYTDYEIQVAAVNSRGKGLASVINVTTKLAVPDPPSIQVVNQTNTSIYVHWKLSDFYRGPNPIYELKVKKAADVVLYTVLANKSREENYNISKLMPYTTYRIQIMALNAAGIGRWSDFVEAKTLVGVPSAPSNLVVDSKTPTSVVLSWDVPDPPNGIILRYMVKWKKRSQPKQTNETDINLFNAIDLSPYTEYEFQVCALTDAGWGNWSKTLKTRTDVGLPSEPLNLTEASVTSSTISIQWQVPKHKNGPHLDYVIRWAKAEDDVDDYDYYSETSKVVFYPSSSMKDEINETSYEITNLDPYTNYSIEVCGKNIAGEGNYTKPLIIQTTAGKPSSPKNVKTIQIQPTSMTVQWLAPETTNGPLVGYVLHWGVIGTDASQIKIHGNSYAALGLRPYTEYFFKIAAETEGGQGPFATILRRTGIASPSAPMKFAYSSVTDHCVLLNWSPPEHPNAPTLRYLVRWKEVSDDSSTQVHESNTTSFRIRELAPDTNYSVQVSGVTDVGQGPWTDVIYVHTRPKDHSSAIIAGSVVGSLIVLFIIGIVIVLLLAKKKGGLKNLIPKSKPQVNNSSETLKTTDISICLDELHETGKISVRNFDEHVLKLMSNGYYGLAREFEKLGKESPGFPSDEAKKSDNLTKNRWVKILPFDYSRVKIRPVGDEVEPDFINASYIPGDSYLLEYIATQGPLPNTVNDFWRMVWQESVFLVVMLTQCVERAKRTCERYWPSAGSTQQYGEIEVHSVSESITPLYIQRLLLVTLGGKQRHIVHLHYMNWPVAGCPKSPDDFLSFVRSFRSQLNSSVTGPTLVHCSAGIGRTGTFIAVDRLLQQINRQCEDVDVYGTILELRKYRANLVQTEEQYYFIYLCLQRIIQEKRQEMENDYGGGIYSN